VSGTGFLSGATVQWNGSALPTTFVSATQLTASVAASLIATAGNASVTVANPGGAASSAFSFTVVAAAAVDNVGRCHLDGRQLRYSGGEQRR
jgi:uncharacterized protein (TIGR03437 family)